MTPRSANNNNKGAAPALGGQKAPHACCVARHRPEQWRESCTMYAS